MTAVDRKRRREQANTPRSRFWIGVQVVSTLVTGAGLGFDAYVHLDLAHTYDAVHTTTLSQGDLFRFEAGLAILAIVGILVRPRRYTAFFALLTAAGGFGAVLLYRYIDIGSFGPIPSMYEPVWYAEKTQSAWAEVIAAIAAAVLTLVLARQRRRRPTKSEAYGV
jgi:hypothetical protein